MPMKKFLKGLYATFNGGKYVLLTIAMFLLILPALNYMFPALGGLDLPTEIGVYIVGSLLFMLFIVVYFYLPTSKFVTFTIRKGWHFCLPRKVKFTRTGKIAAKVKVTHGMLYDDKSGHTNKLIGFSNGLFHLWRSARIGWRPNGNTVQFIAYIRNKGKLSEFPIASAKPGTTAYLAISLFEWPEDGPMASFAVGGQILEVGVPGFKKNRLGYYTWPYFGGNPKAPHTMTFEVSFSDV